MNVKVDLWWLNLKDVEERKRIIIEWLRKESGEEPYRDGRFAVWKYKIHLPSYPLTWTRRPCNT